MAVFRVEKNSGYTVMSNHHLRNKELTLKAKGLLSQMLSLPDTWDYTLHGLARINKESIDAIRTAVWELEGAGYITRQQGRDARGKLTPIVYTIYEQPQPKQAVPQGEPPPQPTNPITTSPLLENPTTDNPTTGKPMTENPSSDNPMQLNKELSKTDLSSTQEINTDVSSTDSLPFLSLNPFPSEQEDDKAAAPPERKRKEAVDRENDAYRIYREIIKENIEYDHLCQYSNTANREMLDEIVDLMLETVCSSRRRIRIAGDDYPAELVKAKFMKLNSSHIEFVFDCLRENTTKIRNIRQYLRAMLFNAPSTIDSYYTALVAHDMARDGWGKPKSGIPNYSCNEGESL